jgi:DNA polymerase IV
MRALVVTAPTGPLDQSHVGAVSLLSLSFLPISACAMLTSLLVDFNSYFASVEQQVRPELRGRPVGVVPMLADSTCLIAASYEAKRLGVKTLTNVGEAKRKIPDIALVVARHELYIEFHHRAVAIVDHVVPVREVLSIDEMDCELTGRWRDPAKALQLAKDVKAALAKDLGECLKVSIGIGPNTFIAKTASDLEKPDGLVLITRDELPGRIAQLPVRALSGIGKKMEARLHARNLMTVADLARLNRDEMHVIWGSIGGDEMYEKIRGLPQAKRAAASHTISHSHVLGPELRNETDAYAVLNRLTQKAGMRLRKAGWFARRLAVSLKYLNHPEWHHEVRFQETHDSIELLTALDACWTERPQRPRLQLLQVVVNLSDLLEAKQVSRDLFDERPDRDQLFATLDRLNSRFGKNAAYLAGSHRAQGTAKVAIAFNHIPDPKLES